MLPVAQRPHRLAPPRYPPATRGRVVVWGLLARFPFGGMTWQVLHHLRALRRLGFDVWYVEDSDALVRDPRTLDRTREFRPNLRYLADQLEAIGLEDRWVFRPPAVPDLCFGGRGSTGLRDLYREADAVLNLCGSHELRDEHASIRCRVYVQTDPVSLQVAVAEGDEQGVDEVRKYHHLFTYAENLGAPDCLLPTGGVIWHPTRTPVCLPWWETDDPPATGAKVTTIGSWKQPGKEVTWRGETYHWSKDREFERVIDLPGQAELPLELALRGVGEEDSRRLLDRGWSVVRARALADPEAYRQYIRSSVAEFTVAKDQNVRMRTGWFSDRSACYLAAGRPVITQDTGFGNVLPTGEGLFAYSTEDEAAAAIEEVAGDYRRHSSAATAIAREFFDAERVLGDLLRRVGLY